MTVSPASRSFAAVPPVDKSSTFLEARNEANGTIPVLSETEIRALTGATRSDASPLNIFLTWKTLKLSNCQKGYFDKIYLFGPL